LRETDASGEVAVDDVVALPHAESVSAAGTVLAIVGIVVMIVGVVLVTLATEHS
jgi:hypothetical protein